MSWNEHKVWTIDQKINQRGVLADHQLINSAISISDQIQAQLAERAIELTGLVNPNSRDQLLGWLNEAGDWDEELTTLRKADVPELVRAATCDDVREVLELRQQMAKTSVKKYSAMLRTMGADNRIRGTLQYYGANRTGRWAGRFIQPQNMVSNSMPDLLLAREVIRSGDAALAQALFDSVPDVLAQLVRTALIPPPGEKMTVADFSAIEAVITAYLSWCEWRLEVFRTHGRIYEASASEMFKVPFAEFQEYIDRGKKHPLRKKGKIGELALGFLGGEGALINMGALDMGLTREELPGIVKAWRAASPEIPKFAYKLQDTAIEALTERKGEQLWVKAADGRTRIGYRYESGQLFCTLPSGRKIVYVRPRYEEEWNYDENGKLYLTGNMCISYWGRNQKTGRWEKLKTWAGKLLENVVQAMARDCLAAAMIGCDDAGIPMVLLVHDEIVNERACLEQTLEIMGRPLAWAPDLPLRAAGFESPFYMKEID